MLARRLFTQNGAASSSTCCSTLFTTLVTSACVVKKSFMTDSSTDFTSSASAAQQSPSTTAATSSLPDTQQQQSIGVPPSSQSSSSSSSSPASGSSFGGAGSAADATRQMASSSAAAAAAAAAGAAASSSPSATASATASAAAQQAFKVSAAPAVAAAVSPLVAAASSSHHHAAAGGHANPQAYVPPHLRDVEEAPHHGAGQINRNNNGSTSSSDSTTPKKKKSLIQEGMRVSAFAGTGPTEPVAIGNVVAQLAENLYSVKFEVPDSGTIIEVGTRVVSETEYGTTSAGLVAHVHGDGTFSILYDDDILEKSVPRDRISVSSGRLAMNQTALDKYEGVVDWIREAGVQKRIDILSAAIVLYRRGWRRDNMYLLEAQDVHCLSHLNKSVRQGILEQAEDEKGKRRVRRDYQHELLKEKQHIKYFLAKYSGIFGAFTGAFAALSVFFWNYKNYKRQQRPAQIEACVENMMASTYHKSTARAPTSRFRSKVAEEEIVPRAETDRLCAFLQSIDNEHPQLIFVTGNTGSGKSTTTIEAAKKLGAPHVMVELRGNEKNDPIRAIAKTMGVTSSMDLCGDLFQFTTEICEELKRKTGRLPVIVLKPKAGGFSLSAGASAFNSPSQAGTPVNTAQDMGYVFNDALSLVTERRCANILVELDTDSLTSLPHLPRTSIFHVEDMTDDEAVRYLAHRIDPVAVFDVLETIGTNTIDLDECVSAVRHHEMDVDDFICRKLSKTVATIRRQPLDLQTLLSEVAQQPFHAGLRKRLNKMDEAVAKGFLMYHWEHQTWMFRSRVMYEAATIVGAWS